MSTTMPEPTAFGAPMLAHFQFDPAFKNLNHGSFGTCPKSLQKVLQHYQSLAESRPDPFIRYDQPVALDAARHAIAAHLNTSVHDCVFVKNATTGVNTVLRNLAFQPGDVVLYFDTVYGAVEKTIASLEETTPVRGVKIEYDFPITHAELVHKFRETVRRVNSSADGGKPRRTKVAVFETVVSVPGIRFPVEELVNVCREEGVLSLVDAAHAVGMIPVDLGRLKPDFWTSNCHKWLFTPRSCAVLYVAPQNQHLIRTTLPTSWGFVPASDEDEESRPTPLTLQSTSKTRFEMLFQFVATTDDSQYLCVPDALAFREKVCGGEERIFEYLDKLANEGGNVVAAKLGTEVLQEPQSSGVSKGGEGSKFRRCAMVNVRLPVSIGPGSDSISEGEVQGVVKWVGETLVQKYGTYVPVFRYGGALWTRLSAQVYLERSDFEWIGDVLREVCDGIRRREYQEC